MNPADRFSDRVEDYVRYRPGYPRELVDVLRQDCGLTAGAAIADIGCGPGNLARVFLDNGNAVFGVEPNAPMREASRRLLASFPRFRALDGSAESTGLPAGSIDFVVAGQAFHWFEPASTRAEFRRILKPAGWVALIWNERAGSSPFDLDYEAMLVRHGVDYQKIRASRDDPKSIAVFFEGGEVRRRAFPNAQSFDFEGLKGRLLSSSYAPGPGHPAHEPMLAELREVFDRHQVKGSVRFDYETAMSYGRLRPRE